MKVYRLEKNGLGPFVGRTSYYASNNRRKIDKQHHLYQQIVFPEFEDRHKRHRFAIRTHYVFAAKTKPLLKAYFVFNLQPYFKLGYKIKEYEVPESEIIDLGHELAFPVKYHKFKTAKKLDIESNKL